MRNTLQLWSDQPPPGTPLNWGHPLTRGLLGCWLFNDGAGQRVTDYCPAGHHLTFSNTRPFWREGRFGGRFHRSVGMAASGTGLVRNPAIRQEILLPPQISVEFWFTATTATTTNGYFFLIATSAGGFPKIRVMKNGAGTELYSQFYLTSGSVDSTGVKNVLDGKLHHYVGTYNQIECRTYVDGRLDGTITAGTLASSTSAATELHFGGYATGTNLTDATYYKASYWGRSVTADEVRWLYENPFCMFAPYPRRASYDVPGAAVGQPMISRLRGIPGASPGRIFPGGWS